MENEKIKLFDVKKLKIDVSSLTTELKKGNEVEVVRIGERGYDIKDFSSGRIIRRCGWDIFE